MSGLRAFAVTEKYDLAGSIVFAAHDVGAKRQVAGDDIGSVSCRRAPWADEYVGRSIPARVMVAHGWYFECTSCATQIDEDSLYDRGLTTRGVLGNQGGAVFCSPVCARRYHSLARRRKAEEGRAIEAFKEIVRRRFPDADFCDEDGADRYRERHHAYVIPGPGGWHWHQIRVSFRFPGMRIGPAHYRLDGTYRYGPDPAGYTCCNGDREAFEAWAASTKRDILS